VVTATIAEASRFHDDKATYTANLRGEHAPPKGDSSMSLPTPIKPTSAVAKNVERTFGTYARFGDTHESAVAGMTCRNFVKLAKDCELLDKNWLTTAFLDLTFAKVARGANRISYEHFLVALELCAQEKGCEASELHAKIVASTAGPVVTATIAEASRLHDDQTTYTANLRGEHAPLSKGDSSKSLPTPTKPTSAVAKSVERMFGTYERFGETAATAGMSCRNFVKLAKDCELLDKRLTVTVLDLAFAKARNAPGGLSLMSPEKSKNLSFEQFLVALELCRVEKGCKISDLYAQIGARADRGPVVNATVAEHVRFHDKSDSGYRTSLGQLSASASSAASKDPSRRASVDDTIAAK